ncbi:MAG: phosphopentomutase [Solirubrobacteraceae bacterium]
MRRAFVIVLDACGVGALPDADFFGDAGANTLRHLAELAGGLQLPTLERLGLGSILELDGVAKSRSPVVHGALHALGPGKDSTAGHWELMGVVMPAAPPTYPNGFPPEVVAIVERAAGRPLVCNRPYNGIGAIHDFGSESLEHGAVIVYTSQDSVLQIAAHTELVSAEQLYEICLRVRGELPSEHAVGRVIARPFVGAPGALERTNGRRDFSLAPPTRSYLVELHDAGVPVHTVGKVGELFSGVGIDVQHPGPTNAIALAETSELVSTLDHGLVFTNLIETDQVYGHRHDVDGFHRALREIDVAVAGWLGLLRDGDLLVLSADHGCDPAAAHTDHTREHVPLLASFSGHHGRRHDGPMADVGASVMQWLTGEATELPGSSFV